MTVRADLLIPAAEFALPSVFEAVPDATVEVEPGVAQTDEATLHLWVLAEAGGVTDLLRRDETTRSVELLRSAGRERLYGVEWAAGVRETLAMFLVEEATILALVGRDGRWQFDVRCCGRDVLASLQSALDDAGHTVTVDRIRATDARGGAESPLLTEKQRAALAVALRAGYYEVPRDVTMSDLAGDLDISQQALSKRLRRAHAKLASHHLLDAERDR